jgi:hypothetical protein
MRLQLSLCHVLYAALGFCPTRRKASLPVVALDDFVCMTVAGPALICGVGDCGCSGAFQCLMYGMQVLSADGFTY